MYFIWGQVFGNLNVFQKQLWDKSASKSNHSHIWAIQTNIKSLQMFFGLVF